MVALTNSSSSFIPQSQSNTDKSKSSSNKITDENQFVKRIEKSSANLIFDKSYKIDLASDKLSIRLSTPNEAAPGNKKTDITPPEKNEAAFARNSKVEISNSTIKSAIKLYTIIKGDILIENHHDFKTGPVNFYV